MYIKVQMTFGIIVLIIIFYLTQVVDYAIARRIVDLHSRIDESIERVYSVEDITRYIMFARQFKPKVFMCFLMQGIC